MQNNTDSNISQGADILIVDDTPANLKLLVSLLGSNGYKVRPALSGEIALRSVEVNKPDLILLDIRMPKMDGFEVCKHLKNSLDTKDIPVIFISAMDDISDKVKAFNVGGIDYITKPFEKEEVLARIKTHVTLNSLQKELQSQNNQLKYLMKREKEQEDMLIEQSKMASLGELVAGVAHEINTPVGLSITGITHLKTITEELNVKYLNNTMTNTNFKDYLLTSLELNESIYINLKRTAELVKNFKMVAVDQSNDKKDIFFICEKVNQVLVSLHSALKHTKIDVEVECDETIKVNKDPGAIFQILTNFVTNSMIHGFQNMDNGKINITIYEKEKNVYLVYRDNGNGIEEDVLPKIFNPFFTTNRALGGVGLGLHIVYNIINLQLDGHINTKSKIGEGVEFEVVFKNN